MENEPCLSLFIKHELLQKEICQLWTLVQACNAAMQEKKESSKGHQSCALSSLRKEYLRRDTSTSPSQKAGEPPGFFPIWQAVSMRLRHQQHCYQAWVIMQYAVELLE